MPDFERVTRDISICCAKNDEREKLKAYYKGLDTARKEIAYIALGVFLVYFALKVLFII